MKAVKGNYSYIRLKRKHVILQTALLFAAALGIFTIGYIIHKSRNNLYTIAAVLMCLPACKSTVSLIMFLRAGGCSQMARDAILPVTGRLIGMYDMFFTSYQKNFAVSHMVVDHKTILAYTEAPSFDVKAFQEHITSMLKQGGILGGTVSVSTELEKYCEQLRLLNVKKNEDMLEKDDEIRAILYDISL